QLRDPSVRLDLSRVLIHKRSHVVENALIFYSMALHGVPPSNCPFPCPFPLLTWLRRSPGGALAASARSPLACSSRMGRTVQWARAAAFRKPAKSEPRFCP